MAKELEYLKSKRQQIVVNPNTTGNDITVKNWLKESAWTGEIAVQRIDNDKAKLWTLGKDNETGIDFIDHKTVSGYVWDEQVRAISAETYLSGAVETLRHDTEVSADTLNDKIEELSAATIESANTLSGYIKTLRHDTEVSADTLYDMIVSATPKSNAKTLIVTPSLTGTNLEVNLDNLTISADTTTGVIGTLLHIESAATLPSESNIREKFYLADKDGNNVLGGKYINIYNDSALEKVYLGRTDDTVDEETGVITTATTGAISLNFVYTDQGHKFIMVKVPVSQFFTSEIFKNGFEILESGAKINVKIDANSDDYLTVGPNGVLLSGVEEDFRVLRLDTEHSANTIYLSLKELSAATIESANTLSGYIKTLRHDTEVSADTLYNLISGLNADVKELSAATIESANTLSGYIKTLRHDTEISAHTINTDLQELSAWTEFHVGSGWAISSITEVIVEDEKITSKALNDLSNRISGATSALTELSASTVAEIGRSISADTFLSGAIETLRHDTEVSANTLSGYVWNEEVRAEAAENFLSGAIDTLRLDTEHSANTLNDKIDELSAATIESADTLYKMIKKNAVHSSANTILIQTVDSGTNIDVNIDNTTIGKDVNGILGTLLLISAMTPSASNIKDEYALVDKDGIDIPGSTHIKIGQPCKVSGETMSAATIAHDKLGHVTVDSALTDGIVIYTIDRYDIASNSALTELSAATIESANTLSGYIKTLRHDTEVSANTLSGYVWNEEVRAEAAENFLSGAVDTLRHDTEVSADTLNDKIEELSAATIESANTLSGYIKTLRHDTEVSADTLYDMIVANAVHSSANTILIQTADSGTNIDVNIDNITIGKDGNGVLGSLLKISSITPTAETVLREYILVGNDGSAIGEHITIDKDKHLKNVYLGKTDDTIDENTGIITSGTTGHTALCFVYILANGKYTLVPVDIEKFLEEQEFKSGVTATNHIVHGVVANFNSARTRTYNDEFLFVDGDGFYTSGLSEAFSAVSVTSSANTILVGAPSLTGTNLEVNIDNETIGKDANGVLGTLLRIASAIPTETSVKDEYKLVDKDGNDISGSVHIKIGQSCKVSGETMTQAIAAVDMLGHVTVDSATTADGIVVYTVDKYDVASNSALTELSAWTKSRVGSGWVESSITEVIISNEKVVARAINDLNLRVSANTEDIKELSGATSKYGVHSNDKTITVASADSGTNIEVNIDNKTIGKDVNGVLGALLLISSVTPSAGIKEEYALVDINGDEISGSTHIKIGQTCKVSGETMDEAIAAADMLGHVTVDSAMTSAGTVIYTIDKYDVASNSALTELSAWTESRVGSGWVESSITEVIIENEEIFTAAFNNLNTRISGMTSSVAELSASTIAEINRSTDTDNVLSGQIITLRHDTEVSANTLSGYVWNEEVRAEAAEYFLSGAIETLRHDTEVSANTLSGYVWDEQVRAKAAEDIISGYVRDNEYVVAAALNNLNLRVSANTDDIADVISPATVGTAGQPLLSSGTEVPVWGSYKFEFMTQAEYDALVTKDATTIYFIVG